ncbi:uncharacterized protein LOC18444960 [Amborella trichopoda]|uniref:uncharacterized protein LOC18444960 n=1 Tax=Amborella trichopoda TaxID=13333 RepID=UPI0009C0D65A|nr:uncharacterized protein LOC18444960 [Amborella trichopoda]|eukprot:XP_020529670.1 uncharacterized protein LOC18444960 [Amborella trichopoda]
MPYMRHRHKSGYATQANGIHLKFHMFNSCATKAHHRKHQTNQIKSALPQHILASFRSSSSDDGGSSSTQSFLPSHSSPHLLNYLRSHILLHHHHHQEKGRQHGDDGEETISASSQQTKGFAIASSDPCRCPRCLPLFSCLRDDASSAPATGNSVISDHFGLASISGGGEEVAEERKDKISPEEPQVMQTPQQVSSSPSHDATQSFAYSGRRLGTWIEGHDDIFTKRRKVNHEKTLNTDQYGYGISGYYNRILQTPSNVREPSDTLRTRPPKVNQEEIMASSLMWLRHWHCDILSSLQCKGKRGPNN